MHPSAPSTSGSRPSSLRPPPSLPAPWQPYEPTPANPWDRRKVAHLYRRAAFGVTWAELEEGVKLGPRGCVDRVLNARAAGPVTEEDFAAMARTAVAGGSDRNLQGWWLYRMMAGQHPLME